MNLFDGSSYSSSPERSPENKGMTEILDIKDSTKCDTTFIKRRELVEKDLLDTIGKKLKIKFSTKKSHRNLHCFNVLRC